MVTNILEECAASIFREFWVQYCKNIKCGYILVIVIVNIVIVIVYFILIIGEIYKKKKTIYKLGKGVAVCSTFLQNDLVLCVSINKLIIIMQNIVHIFVR